jgi:hypothetical protein
VLGPRVLSMLKSELLVVGMDNKDYGYSKPAKYVDAPSNSFSVFCLPDAEAVPG